MTIPPQHPRPDDGLAPLAAAFGSPPRKHTVRPFWFWNDVLDARETARQIDSMQEQGVHGAYLDCRSGLRPRYLSEEWWRLVRDTVEHADSTGFLLGASDEYNWPAGEARDWTLPGTPSRVLLARPDLRMTRLAVSRVDAAKGEPVAPSSDPDEFTVLAELDAERIDPESLHVVSRPARAAKDSVVYRFRLEPTVGFDGGLVDLLDPAATELYIDLVYEEYRRRLGDRFGGAFFGFFVDHEGDYGRRLAWNPGLERALAERSGGDFRPLLPLLLDDLDGPGIAVRSMYLEEISRRYAENFFGRLSGWCAEHGVSLTAHTWEENLHASPAFQGDFFAIQRALQTPGVDSLFTWGDHPRHLLEAASVAHERRTPLVVENQGVQGADSYLSPDRLKGPTAALALWGATDFVPHAFHASARRMEFPEDWFEAQPWWVGFRAYADLASRLSLVGSVARKSGSVALVHPRESAWALSAPVFDEEAWDYGYADFDLARGSVIAFGNDLDAIEAEYSEVMESLAVAGCDPFIADETSLAHATVTGGASGDASLEIAGDEYRTIVLTSVRSMHRAALERLVEFAERGGMVVSTGTLPTASVESGGGDPVVADAVARLRSAPGFRSLAPADAVALIAASRDRELGPLGDGLLRSTRELPGGERLHLIFNRDAAPRRVALDLPGDEPVELWRFETGARARLADGGGPASLLLGPHEVVAVVRGDSGAPPASPEGPPLAELAEVGDEWTVEFDPPELPVPWAPALEGTDDADRLRAAPLRRLEADEHVLRRWWLIGPYDYGVHTGYDTVHPPEALADETAEYDSGPSRWLAWIAPDRFVDCAAALALASPQWEIERATTAYATTLIDVPRDIDAELRIVADANAKVWVDGEVVFAERDDHHGYLELHDGFASRVPLHLTAGRHRLLVKVSQGTRMGGALGFAARLCTPDGAPLYEVREAGPGASEPGVSALEPAISALLDIPAGAHALVAPGAERAVVDGTERPVVDGRVGLEPGDAEVVVAWPLGGGPRGGVCFVTSPAPGSPGSLTDTPARWWAGRAAYRARVELPDPLPAGTVLDLGEVGVVGRVTVNGVEGRMLPWAPYAIDLDGSVRPGPNDIEVEVWNTGAHRRAGLPPAEAFPGSASHGPALLSTLHRNGLLGPVRILAPAGRPLD